MIPNQTLIQPPVSPFVFVPPDGNTIDALNDWQLGGNGIQDPSLGLEVQNWQLTVMGSALTTQVYVSAPNTPPTLMFSRPNITWARLTFDQNMNPMIAFVDQGGPTFWWFSPFTLSQIFTTLPPGTTTPCCTMDDKRALATRLGINDVILAYIKNNSLFYRQQRDQYSIEYALLANVQNIVPNPTVYKIGMNEGGRLMFKIQGFLF